MSCNSPTLSPQGRTKGIGIVVGNEQHPAAEAEAAVANAAAEAAAAAAGLPAGEQAAVRAS